MSVLKDPRQATAFRFVRCTLAGDTAELVYAYDQDVELIERIRFPGAPTVANARRPALDAALRLLHWVAGVSYYKAGVPAQIAVENGPLDAVTAEFLDALYRHGLGEFAYQNRLDLSARIRFPHAAAPAAPPRPSAWDAAASCRSAAARIPWSAWNCSSAMARTPRPCGSAIRH
ncbi:hypothetical protein [Tahibacter amnicola]|uniref:hypothetical protein n=1 Tax=Tahibacter amnicola TaxID=2976241 RepID=UPI0031B9C21A